jgi:hypothetical protein
MKAAAEVSRRGCIVTLEAPTVVVLVRKTAGDDSTDVRALQ